eukprot:TRINITY_DN8228_c0_g1_i1.p1 TRINITY_DN8228_c0_g1~~TRINITY_DN8228_c0_g1_i1.p1  ORF type:complete len:812 (+),score=202.64 TRINITY_DN8228_c0_g1_i1:192-2627(+)
MATLAQKYEISEVQYAEIKKAFDLVDNDASGSITRDELRMVMKSLGADPSPDQLERLINLMDADRSGTIEWEEFLAVMGGWLKEDASILGSGSASAEDERADTHRKISKFFLQFSRSSNFADIRGKFGGHTYEGMFVDDSDTLGMDMGDDSTATTFTTQAKEESLATARGLLLQLPQIGVALQTPDAPTQQQGLQAINQILAFTERIRTPLERYEHRTDVQAIFDALSNTGVWQIIVSFLRMFEHPQLQWEAARIIAAYAPGARIANSPPDSYLHPRSDICKKAILSVGGAEALLSCLRSQHAEMREQAVLTLTVLAKNHPRIRDALLGQGIMALLIEQLTDNIAVPMLRKVSMLFCVLCGATHPDDDLPQYDLVSIAGEKLVYLVMYCPDEDVVISSCIALSYLLPGVQNANDVLKRMVDLLASPVPRLQRAVLATCRAIVGCDDNQTNLLLQFGLMRSLIPALRSQSRQLRSDALSLCADLAGQSRVQALLETDILADVLLLLGSDEQCQSKALSVVKQISWGTPNQIALVANYNVVQVLAKLLSRFKVYDTVLRDVYNFKGASYNFNMLRDVVLCLTKLLDTAQSAADGSGVLNPIAAQWDHESVDYVSGVLTVLRDDKPQESENADVRVEDALRNLLFRLRSCLNVSKQDSTRALATKVHEMFVRYYPKKDAHSHGRSDDRHQARPHHGQRADDSVFARDGYLNVPSARHAPASPISDDDRPNMVKVKCLLGGDNRTLSVSRDTTLHDLRDQIGRRYKLGARALLQYEDDEGDKLTIDTDKELERAFRRYERVKAKTLKLWVHDSKR